MSKPRHYTEDGRTVLTCAYKGCEHEAIAQVGKRQVCAEHANRVKVTGFGGRITLAEYVARSIEHRDSGKGWQFWQLVPQVAS